MSSTLYTVTETDNARDELTEIWLNYASDRGAITRTSHQIGQALRYDADSLGSVDPKGKSPTSRYLDRYPLRAFFDVSEPDRLVTIVGYGYLSRSSSSSL